MIELVLHLERVAAFLDGCAVRLARLSDRLLEWSSSR
jgi:hypothetical protein